MPHRILNLIPSLMLLSGCESRSSRSVPTPARVEPVAALPVEKERPHLPAPEYDGVRTTVTPHVLIHENHHFPYFIPKSYIPIGETLVDEVNALAAEGEQIRFLLAILPPTIQTERQLTDRQLDAIRLLGLTKSELVIKPLVVHLDRWHTRSGWPCVHALVYIGDPVVEPVIQELQRAAASTKSPDRNRANRCGAVLRGIKKKQIPLFLEELKQRDDVQIPDEVLKSILRAYELRVDDDNS